jgi:hypothetical protein
LLLSLSSYLFNVVDDEGDAVIVDEVDDVVVVAVVAPFKIDNLFLSFVVVVVDDDDDAKNEFFSRVIVTVTEPPSRVNFNAFEIILRITCFNLWKSPIIIA